MIMSFHNPDVPFLHIEELGISRPHRGKRLGRLFLQELVRFAVSFGCSCVELWSLSTARGFYEEIGFVEQLARVPEERAHDMGDHDEPLVRMTIDAWLLARRNATNPLYHRGGYMHAIPGTTYAVASKTETYPASSIPDQTLHMYTLASEQK